MQTKSFAVELHRRGCATILLISQQTLQYSSLFSTAYDQIKLINEISEIKEKCRKVASICRLRIANYDFPERFEKQLSADNSIIAMEDKANSIHYLNYLIESTQNLTAAQCNIYQNRSTIVFSGPQ